MIPSRAITFRKASLEDLDFLFELRNEPSTRASSISTKELTKEEHEAWFKTTTQEVYVATLKGEDFGSVRFNELEMSWAISPKFRGQGLGKLMVRRARKLKPGNHTARIRKTNLASLKIAHEAGISVSLVD